MVHRVQGSDLTVSLEASLLPTQPRLVTPPQLSLQGAEMSESLSPPAAWEKEGGAARQFQEAARRSQSAGCTTQACAALWRPPGAGGCWNRAF